MLATERPDRIASPAAPAQVEAISVWLVEDNDLYRRTIAGLINETSGMRCPLAVARCEEALEALEDDLVPEIVLMDIGLAGMNGIEGTRQIRARSPASRIIMLTVHEENDKVFEAICAGASGYLLKPSSANQIVEAIREVQSGAAPLNAYIARKMLDMFARLAVPRTEYGLTNREQEILHLMVEGLTTKRIGERLFLSYHTIDTHIRNIYDKLHVHSRSGAISKALKERLV